MAYDASVSGNKGVTVEQARVMGEALKYTGPSYEHPTQQAMLGEPTSNQTPSFGGTFTVSQIASDFQGHVSSMTDRTVRIPDSVATSSNKGLMSAADKVAHDKAVQDIGTMSNLLTTEKGSLVGAVNDVDSRFLCGGVPYGKELAESWQSLRTRIVAGDFSGIHIGDYKVITLTTSEVVIMEVAGIDQYYKCVNTEIGHHIDFISRDCLAGGKRMNESNTNNGTAAEKHPWLASELYQTLNDETTGVFAKLPSDLKPYIITKRALLEERYSSGGAVSEDTGWSWANMGKLWLPTEPEIFGTSHWSEPGYGTSGGGCNLRYPLFEGGAKHIIKGDGNGSSRCNWWEASAYRTNAAHFCGVSSNGYANVHSASNAGVRAPLCFRIG